MKNTLYIFDTISSTKMSEQWREEEDKWAIMWLDYIRALYMKIMKSHQLFFELKEEKLRVYDNV